MMDANHKPSVLFLSGKIGSIYEGGVSAAASTFYAQLRRSFGEKLDIFATAFALTPEEQNLVKKYHISDIIYPRPKGRFAKRLLAENSDYFHFHDMYFPHLEELSNVKIIFAFGMVSSDSVQKIKDNLFPTAEVFLVNAWSAAKLKPSILGCGVNEMNWRLDSLIKEESEKAKAIFSIGPGTFAYFNNRYNNDAIVNVKHIRFFPLIKELLNPPNIWKKTSELEIQILSVYQEEGDVAKLEILAKVVHGAIEAYRSMQHKLPHWTILGLPSSKEKRVKKIGEKNKIEIRTFPGDLSNETFTRELCCSRLLLILPSCCLSLKLSLLAIAHGTPVLMDDKSDCSTFIEEYLGDFNKYMISIEEISTDKVIRILRKPEQFHKMTEKARKKLVEICNRENVNDEFILMVGQILNMTPRTSGHEELQSPPENKIEKPIEDKVKQTTNYQQKRRSRCFSVNVDVDRGVPVQGKSVQDMVESLYIKDEEAFEAALTELERMHPGLIKKFVDKMNKKLVLECTSEDGLDYVETANEDGSLKKLIEEIILTEGFMEKIGAYALSLRVDTNYEEYEQCKKEFAQERHAVQSGSGQGFMKFKGEVSETSLESSDAGAGKTFFRFLRRRTYPINDTTDKKKCSTEDLIIISVAICFVIATFIFIIVFFTTDMHVYG